MSSRVLLHTISPGISKSPLSRTTAASSRTTKADSDEDEDSPIITRRTPPSTSRDFGNTTPEPTTGFKRRTFRPDNINEVQLPPSGPISPMATSRGINRGNRTNRLSAPDSLNDKSKFEALKCVDTINLPCGRRDHAVANIGDQFLMVFGGFIPSASSREDEKLLNDLWAYDIGRNEWSCVCVDGSSDVDGPSRRKGHSMVSVNDGRSLVVFGGMGTAGYAASSGQRRRRGGETDGDGDGGRGAILRRMGSGSDGGGTTSMAVGSELIYYNDVWLFETERAVSAAGAGDENESPESECGETYSIKLRGSTGVTGRWRRLCVSGDRAELTPTGRARHSSVIYDKFMIVFGGYGCSEDISVWVFDLEDEIWHRMSVRGDMKPARRFSHVSTVWNDCLYIFGGETKQEAISNGDVWKLSLKECVWSKINAPSAVAIGRTEHAACRLGQRWIIHGGISDFRDPYYKQGQGLFEFDMKTEKWRVLSSAFTPSPSLVGHEMIALEKYGVVSSCVMIGGETPSVAAQKQLLLGGLRLDFFTPLLFKSEWKLEDLYLPGPLRSLLLDLVENREEYRMSRERSEKVKMQLSKATADVARLRKEADFEISKRDRLVKALESEVSDLKLQIEGLNEDAEKFVEHVEMLARDMEGQQHRLDELETENAEKERSLILLNRDLEEAKTQGNAAAQSLNEAEKRLQLLEGESSDLKKQCKKLATKFESQMELIAKHKAKAKALDQQLTEELERAKLLEGERHVLDKQIETLKFELDEIRGQREQERIEHEEAARAMSERHRLELKRLCDQNASERMELEGEWKHRLLDHEEETQDKLKQMEGDNQGLARKLAQAEIEAGKLKQESDRFKKEWKEGVKALEASIDNAKRHEQELIETWNEKLASVEKDNQAKQEALKEDARSRESELVQQHTAAMKALKLKYGKALSDLEKKLRSELVESQTKLDETSVSLEATKGELANMRKTMEDELNGAKAQIETLKERVQELQSEEAKLKSTVKELAETTIPSLEDENSSLREELQQRLLEMEEMKQEFELELAEKGKIIEERTAELRERIREVREEKENEYAEDLRAAKEALEKQIRDLTQISAEAAETARDTEGRQMELQRELEGRKENEAALSMDVEQLRSRIRLLETQLEDMGRTKVELEESLKTQRQELLESKNAIRRMEEDAEHTQQHVQELQSELEKAEVRSKTLSRRLADSDAAYTDAVNAKDLLDAEIAELQEEITKCRRRNNL